MNFFQITRNVPTLTAAEQKLLLKKTGERRGAEREFMMYSLALGTALREHEIVALNIRDVMHAGAVRAKIQLTIFKDHVRASKRKVSPNRRIKQQVHLPKATRRKLAYYLKWKKKQGESLRPDAPLFVTSQAGFGAVAGERLSTRTIRHHFHKWQKICNFEHVYGFHVLRHTSLSNLYRETKDIMVVKAQARHGNVSTTQIYTHVDDDLAKAVEDLPC
jgi:integrase/recombinase XerC